MRIPFLLLIPVFLFSCGEPHHPEKPKARGSTLVFVDTLQVRTGGGQLIHLTLLQNLDSCVWIFGHDTIPDKNMTRSRLADMKLHHKTPDFLPRLDDTSYHFHEPVIAVSQSELCAIAALPDSVLRGKSWIVKGRNPDGTDQYCLAAIYLVQLDEDPAQESIAELDFSKYDFHRYIVFDSFANGWAAISTIDKTDRRSGMNSVITTIQPYFGLLDFTSGSSASNLSIYKLVSDTVAEVLKFSEYQMDYFTVYGAALATGLAIKVDDSVMMQKNRLVLDHQITLMTFPRDKKLVFLEKDPAPITFRYDEHVMKFIPENNNGWVRPIMWNTPGSYSFQLFEYTQTRMSQLARTGTKMQREILDGFK